MGDCCGNICIIGLVVVAVVLVVPYYCNVDVL